MKTLNAFTISLFVLLAAGAQSQLGPLVYLQSSDSPWASNFGNGQFYLEDFEDGLLNTPGVTSTLASSVIGPGGLTDSVDGDDGVIDGSGTAGRSYFRANGTVGMNFTFGSGTYGALPTHAGLVWTDGLANQITRFEAFDAGGLSLGVITGNHAGASVTGSTSEDRFYGWVNTGGISRISISHPGGGIEIDHLQYGASAVPEPASMIAMGVGIAGILARRRKR